MRFSQRRTIGIYLRLGQSTLPAGLNVVRKIHGVEACIQKKIIIIKKAALTIELNL